MCVTKNHALGYLARSVASLVNGCWVNPDPLKPLDMLTSVVTMVRSCINRSGGNDAVVSLIAKSVARRTGLQRNLVKRILVGEIAIGDGPCYSSDVIYKNVNLQINEKVLDDIRTKIVEYPSEATHAYLSEHTQPIEIKALDLLEVSIVNDMKGASYAKSLCDFKDSIQLDLKVLDKKERRVVGSYVASDLSRRNVVEGILTHYPLLNLIKNRLTKEMCKSLLDSLHVKYSELDVMHKCWGYDFNGKIIRGVLPYSDAANLCKKCPDGIIYVTFPIAM